MAVEAIKLISEKLASKISPKKAEKAAKVAVEDGEKMLATGQDAAAIQGRAMVKPYTKPEMEKANLKKENMQAASGGGSGKYGGGEEEMPDAEEARSFGNYVDWGDVWE